MFNWKISKNEISNWIRKMWNRLLSWFFLVYIWICVFKWRVPVCVWLFQFLKNVKKCVIFWLKGGQSFRDHLIHLREDRFELKLIEICRIPKHLYYSDVATEVAHSEKRKKCHQRKNFELSNWLWNWFFWISSRIVTNFWRKNKKKIN